MRLRGAWCTDRGSPTESRVSSSTPPLAPSRITSLRAATPATAAMATAEDIGAHVFDEGHWYHETLEEGLAISYRVRARAARSIVVVAAAASERRTTDALSESSSPSINPIHLRSPSPSSLASPPRRRRRANRTSRVGRPRPSARSLSLSRARVLVAVAPPALTRSSRRRRRSSLPSRRWTRSCTADRARSRPWRS